MLKTHSIKVIALLFLLNFMLGIFATNRFILNVDYTLIILFSRNLIIDKVVNSFVIFPKSTRTLKIVFV